MCLTDNKGLITLTHSSSRLLFNKEYFIDKVTFLVISELFSNRFFYTVTNLVRGEYISEKVDLYKITPSIDPHSNSFEGEIIFPTSLVSRCLDILTSNKVKFEIFDRRVSLDFNFTPTKTSEVSKISKPFFDIKFKEDAPELRPYQKDAVTSAIKATRGIAQIGTGGGKTLFSCGLIKELGLKTLYIVNTAEALKDTKKEIKNSLEIKCSDEYIKSLSLFFQGVFTSYAVHKLSDLNEITKQVTRKLKNSVNIFTPKGEGLSKNIFNFSGAITLTTMASFYSFLKHIKALHKNTPGVGYPDITDFMTLFDLVIIDECHRSGSFSWYSSIMALNSKYKIGITGTAKRKTGSILLEACLGPIFSNYSTDFLIKKGYLMKPEIFFVPVENTLVGGNNSGLFSFNSIYNIGVVYHKGRNNAILKEIIRYKDNITLVSVNRIEHIKEISNLLDLYNQTNVPIPYTCITGSPKAKNFRSEVQEAFFNGVIKTLIATNIYNESANFPKLEVIINAAGNKFSTPVLQRLGRVLRQHPDKDKCVYIDFTDTHIPLLERQSQARYKAILSENIF